MKRHHTRGACIWCGHEVHPGVDGFLHVSSRWDSDGNTIGDSTSAWKHYEGHCTPPDAHPSAKGGDA